LRSLAGFGGRWRQVGFEERTDTRRGHRLFVDPPHLLQGPHVGGRVIAAP
jgi:hypothetical protein